MKFLILFLFLSLTFGPGNASAEKLQDFVLNEYKSNLKTTLSEKLNGKKALINFWASWCTSCVHEIPQLESLKAKYGKDVHFFAINAGEKSNLIERFINKNKFTYTILLDDDRTYSKLVGVNSLPVTIVVDKDLNILYRGFTPPSEL